MMLKSVDFPHPDGPMRVTNSPASTVKDMRSTATTAPSGVSKRLATSSMTSSGIPPFAGDGRDAVAGAVAVVITVPRSARAAKAGTLA